MGKYVPVAAITGHGPEGMRKGKSSKTDIAMHPEIMHQRPRTIHAGDSGFGKIWPGNEKNKKNCLYLKNNPYICPRNDECSNAPGAVFGTK